MQTRLEKLNAEQQENILRHLVFVLNYNNKVNLTSITTYEEGLLLHVEDSLAGLDEVNNAPDGMLVDLGSGGGFPGIPLAIATRRKTTLIEAVAKKAEALTLFVEQEHLEKNIQVVSKRSEEYARENSAHFSVVTARAVSELPVLVELASPLLIEGGILMCYKGRLSEEELKRGCNAATLCGLRERSHYEFQLVDAGPVRSFVVYEKTSKPLISLPRRNGIAKKRPLI